MPVIYAQEISPFEQIADFYHQRAGAYSCEFASNAIKKIRNQNEDQIRQTIKNSLNALKVNVESNQIGLKDKIILGLETICRKTKLPIQKISHSLALSNSVLVNAAAVSVGVPVNLLKGAFTTKKAVRRDDFIYHVMGPQNGEGPFLLGLLLFQSPDLLLGLNPAFALVNGSIAIELITNYQCRSVNPLNKEKIDFCQSYQDLKNFFQKGNEKSFALGLKIKKYLNEKAQTKQTKLGVDGFCELDREKQVDLARKTLERHDFLKNDERIKSAEVLLPIHKNSCAKILLQADEDMLDDLKNDYVQIDSIKVVTLKDGDYPEEYYFSQSELDKLSIDEQLCHDVERDHLGQLAQNDEKFVEDFFKASLAPSLLAQPQNLKVILRDEQVYQGKVHGLRNVILSLAPNSNTVEIKRLRDQRDQIIKEVKKNYKRIIKTKNFKNCLQVLKEKEINVNEFTETIKRLSEIQSNSLIKSQEELDLIRKIVKRSRFRLKLDWELIETNQLKDVMDILKRTDIGNVIIIGHGKSSGHFVDSAGQEFPREAFSEISPSIMSINLYTCHSQKMMDLYQLQEKLSHGNSLYKIRYVTHVAENDFLGSDNYAPLTAFGYYLSKLDRYLQRSVKGASLLQENFQSQLSSLPQRNTCHADLSDLNVKKGSYGIILNDQLIGSTSIAKPAKLIEFDCHFLKAGKNTLKIKSILNDGGSDLDLRNLKLSIENINLGGDQATLKKSSLTILKFDY